MTLYPHQDAAAGKFLRQGSLAVFHEPGLGKTLTALTAFAKLKQQDPNFKMFVLCPKSLINAAWRADNDRFTKLPDIHLFGYEYALLHRIQPEDIAPGPWFGVIDESSRCKSSTSKTTKYLHIIAHQFTHRMALSGTPCPNGEWELWGQLNFVKPNFFPSFSRFRREWFEFYRGLSVVQFPHPRDVGMLFQQGYRMRIMLNKRPFLYQTIEPYVHWMRAKDAINLPETVDIYREVTMNAIQTKAYRDMKRNFLVESETDTITAKNALDKLIKLREITSGFLYCPSGVIYYSDHRLKTLMETLEEFSNEQVIIWAYFHEEIDAIDRALGIRSATLDGRTPDKDQVIKDFKENRIQYLVAHPQSAAHGLTFVNCSFMVFYSLSFSFEQYEQSKKRIHRIGQERPCLYVHLKVPGTIDQDVLDVLQRKRTLQEVMNDYFGTAKTVLQP